MVRANTLGATAIAAAITAGVASLEPANIGAADLWSNRKAVSDEQLDTMRGGFETRSGLQVSFGIERAVFINGELVAATRLIVSNLPNLLSGGSTSAQALANAFTVVQNGPGNSVQNQPAPAPVAASPSPVAVTAPSTAAAASVAPASSATAASAAPASTATAVSAAPASTATAASTTPASTATAASAAPASTATGASATPASTATAASATPASTATAASATAASTVASAGAAPSGLQSVQVGGQTLILPSATAIVTAVQNSVNNQVIQTRTSIDATMNSLSFLRSGAFADALRQEALLSVRR